MRSATPPAFGFTSCHSSRIGYSGRWRRTSAVEIEGLAEREGFEPPIRLPVCRISSAVHSTALPPLRSPKGAAKAPDERRYLTSQAKTDKRHTVVARRIL